MSQNGTSEKIRSRNRAGRAPYNFVPLPKSSRFVEEKDLPDLDRFNGISGEIELELSALTDFYVRGMRDSAPSEFAPFSIAGRLRLPGSSLRGMVRALVEILSQAPLYPANDAQLFFRAVASTDNPRDRSSFEPQATAYKRQLNQDGSESPLGSVFPGYLTGGSDEWRIQPAKLLPGQSKWLRYRTADVWKREKAFFRATGQEMRSRDKLGVPCNPQDPGAISGHMICSGSMPPRRDRSGNKQDSRLQWLIGAPDSQQKSIKVSREDSDAYLDGGVSQTLKSKGWAYSRNSKELPCFFVEWLDLDKQPHVTFAHTPYMRVPYKHRLKDAIPQQNYRKKDDVRWDLAQAIFGRIPGENEAVKGRRGRVCFEDAFQLDDSAETYSSKPAKVVLGAPKPTTYQHYLVQKGENETEAVAWDGDYRLKDVPVVRGHKLYWHRPNAPIRPSSQDQSNVETKIQVAHKGMRFRARLRFENLHDYELGALLFALDLPTGCAHKLGMAKPLGLGSFRIQIKPHEINRDERYRRLFDGDSFYVGDNGLDVDKYRRAFAKWLANDENADLWSDQRLCHLKALLTFEGLPQNWAARTRYLEFGRTEKGLYNEYVSVGGPDKRVLSKRRPLPPATQVIDPKADLPDDPPIEWTDRAPMVQSLRTKKEG